ncbi:MAG: ABC transporter permease subunit [Spirochaetales bacterium]|nr:ABC transporter permease subunit [Spirochaetales bacterium]
MSGLKPILRKELSDHFSSYRFLILFALIAMVSFLMAYMAGLKIREDLEGEVKPAFVFLMLFTSSGIGFPLVQFVALFGPLIGLILGFDSINREWNEGTLSKLLAQPIYRDVVINGKFLSGVLLVTVMMLSIILSVTGLGLYTIGVVPGLEELNRILVYLFVSVIYISFWLGVAILFSILFRTITTSALASLACWIFFSFLVPLAASALANASAPLPGEPNSAYVVRIARLQGTLSMVSPMKLYSDAAAVIVDPLRRTTAQLVQVGMLEKISLSRFAAPLSLQQSILLVIPYIVLLVAIMALFFAASYAIFMRKEIRSL